MCKKLWYGAFLLLWVLGTTTQAATVIWVSDNKGYGDIEPNVPGDMGWAQLLEAQGHTVDYRNQNEYVDGEQYWRTLDANKVAELEAADLIIISRNADSGSYAGVADNEPNLWNAVSTPLINLNGYMARSNKWGWLNTTGTTRSNDGVLTLADPAHPIFDGIVTDANSQVAVLSGGYNVDWASAADAGNGTLLATGAGSDLASIVTWEAGQAYFEGGAAIAGGPRMLFTAGTGSKNSGDSYAPDGMYNLTPAGEQMFLNAVKFMLTKSIDIIWVSDNKGFGDIEPNVPGDIGWAELLQLQGYTVDYRNQNEYIDGEQYWRTLDANKVAELEAADLIIISRNADSGSYAGVADNEPNLWNGVTTPILNLNGYMARSNKWGWLNTTGTSRAKAAMLTVIDADHPVFAGIVTDANGQVAGLSADYNVDWADSNDVGNGTLLATGAGSDLVSIAIWEAGQAYFEGGAAVAGGPRMLFTAGTGSKNSVPDGMYNLTPAGEQMFLNAVSYLTPDVAISLPVENGSFEMPGTEKIKGWNGEGVSGTPAVDIPGWASDEVVGDSGVESDWPGSTDGDWTCFMQGYDPAAYNLTDYVIQAGDVLTLSIDARDNWTEEASMPASIGFNLYYDVDGVRMSLVAGLGELTTSWANFTVSVNVDDVPEAVGALLGVEILNATASDQSWIGADNVQIFKEL